MLEQRRIEWLKRVNALHDLPRPQTLEEYFARIKDLAALDAEGRNLIGEYIVRRKRNQHDQR